LAYKTGLENRFLSDTCKKVEGRVHSKRQQGQQQVRQKSQKTPGKKKPEGGEGKVVAYGHSVVNGQKTLNSKRQKLTAE